MIINAACKAAQALELVNKLISKVSYLKTIDEEMSFHPCVLNLHLVRKFFVQTLAKLTEHCRLFIESIEVNLWKNSKEAKLMRLLEEGIDTETALISQGYEINKEETSVNFEEVKVQGPEGMNI